MSDRYKGAILSPTAPTVTPQSAGGIYTSSQQLQYQGQGVWPSAVNYPINNSLRFRASASAYLNRTPASAGNRRTWTFSFWCKKGKLGTYQTPLWATTTGGTYDGTFVWLLDGDTFGLVDYHGSYGANIVSTAVYRDPSAWYHFICAVDTTQATASNRVKLYVNGVEITALSANTYPSQNYDFDINSNVAHNIGRDAPAIGARNYLDGYLAEVNFIDGVQLTPSSFGTTDAYGIWQPIPYTGAYGTNGFYLPFTDNSALTTSSNVGLGKDFSGNGNYWVTNNISITAGSTYDSMKDVPTNTNLNTANYATLNPINVDPANLSGTITNGNLSASNTTSQALPYSTIGFTTGKYYFEFILTALPSTATALIGVCTSPYAVSNLRAYRYDTGQYFNGTTWVSYGATWTTNDVIGTAIDMTNQTIEFYKNGTSQGQITSLNLTGLNIFPMFYMNANNAAGSINFGQRPFSYTPPSGFYPLNTYNLPTPTILDGDQYFNATTYTGNGSTQSITNSGSMQPDLVWMKSRSAAYYNTLYDVLRGTGTTPALYTNSTDSEGVYATLHNLTSFNSNGFSVGTTSASPNTLNENGATFVAWQWRASNAAGVSNTQGTITSTVSANTTSGFSIVTYTGTGANATVGHGLGVAPSMVIAKSRSQGAGYNWAVYHISTGNTQYLNLNNTNAAATASTVWNNTTPTSTVFSVGTDPVVTGNGQNFVAYCFAAVAGYSAFGSYTGNGSTDGPFVFTGFRPRYVMIKESSGSSAASASWVIFDTARDSDNVTEYRLFANLSDAEVTSNAVGIDILSNGFKLRVTNFNVNESSGTYIYACFAENPFKIARAR